MKNYMELLRRAKIFRGMEEKNILSMLDCLAAVKKRFMRGEFLYRAGEPACMAAFWRTYLQENFLGKCTLFWMTNRLGSMRLL